MKGPRDINSCQNSERQGSHLRCISGNLIYLKLWQYLWRGKKYTDSHSKLFIKELERFPDQTGRMNMYINFFAF